MNNKEKFENFLESLKGNGQDVLIESVKQGFQVCFEQFDDPSEMDDPWESEDPLVGHTMRNIRATEKSRREMKDDSHGSYDTHHPENLKTYARQFISDQLSQLDNTGFSKVIHDIIYKNAENIDWGKVMKSVKTRMPEVKTAFTMTESLSDEEEYSEDLTDYLQEKEDDKKEETYDEILVRQKNELKEKEEADDHIKTQVINKEKNKKG